MMKKRYALTLLSSFTGLLFLQGCDSTCCQNVTPDELIPPTAVITYNGNAIDSITCDPTKEETIILKADKSSDSDGNVKDYIWKEGNTVVQNGEVECPAAGQSKRVCLIAIDDDNLESQPDCVTVIAKTIQQAPELKPPYIKLKQGFKDQAGTGFVGCEELKDQDTIDTDGVQNTYGTDHAIKEIHWHVDYTGREASDWTQTEWNDPNNPSDPDDIFKPGDCGKWIDDAHLPATIKVTPVDDDDQNQTFIYEMDINGHLTLKN